MKSYPLPLALAVTLATLVGCASAPKPDLTTPYTIGPTAASRSELESIRDSLRLMVATPGPDQAAAQTEITHLDRRLVDGDFDVGDVMNLQVAGEAKWTGDFTVRDNRTVLLPDLPPISVQGVLYSEVDSVFDQTLSTYLRDPQVRVRVTKRVAILGAVGSPGFYSLAGDELVADAIMRAGGPAAGARIDRAQLQRNGEAIATLSTEVVQQMTLDDLGVLSGDAIFVPVPVAQSPFLRTLLIITGLAGTVTFVISRF